MLELFDDIDGILVELMDNQIDYDFDIKDKRENFIKFNIRFFSEFIEDFPRMFLLVDFYDFVDSVDSESKAKLKSYIKDAFLTLDVFLKKKSMNVKVRCLFAGGRRSSMSIQEFVELEDTFEGQKNIFTITKLIISVWRRPSTNIKENLVSSTENIYYSLQDDIDGILVELMDNQIDYDFDIKDKREKFLRFDIRFFPKFIKDRYFPYLEFYDRNGKLKPYIKDALLTLDTYLKNKLMIVKVHSLFGNEGMMMSIPEFIKIEGIEATKIRLFSIGVSVNHLERGRSKKIKENMKNILSFDKFNEELVDITSNSSQSGRTKEVDKIYSEENPHIKSRASYLLLRDKYKKAELEDIKKLFTAGIPVYKYKTNDPKLTKILVTLNNLQFLKHRLKEDGELRCEYCDKGPLVIYDIFPDELDNLIGNPYHRLNTKFDPADGATCDHKNPQSAGGDKFDYSNLAVCCNRCNQRKRSIPYDEWMRRIGKANESLVTPRQPDKFNEGFELLNNHNLDKFCKDAFNDFNVSIGSKYISISSKLYDTFFRWDDIKNSFNDFLILLIDKYGLTPTKNVKSKDFGKLLSVHLYSSNGYERIYSVNDCINDEVSVRFFIEEIRIKW